MIETSLSQNSSIILSMHSNPYVLFYMWYTGPTGTHYVHYKTQLKLDTLRKQIFLKEVLPSSSSTLRHYILSISSGKTNPHHLANDLLGSSSNREKNQTIDFGFYVILSIKPKTNTRK